MIEKRKFKGRIVPCPNCKAQLKASWLSGMSNHHSFMYSKNGDAILVEGGDNQAFSTRNDFSLRYPLCCPVCQFEIVTRSSDPSRDKAVFLDGMRYLTGTKEFEVIVETP